MLTHYLLEHGLNFQEAYEVADRVRNEIQNKKTVSADRMVELVQRHSEDVVGDRPIGDGVFWAPRSRQVLVEDDTRTLPFSREQLSHSLVAAGVDEDEAYDVSQRIETDFVREGKTSVERDEIQEAASKVLRSTFGDAYAERYEAWHEFRTRDPAQPLIILIGGASGVGKTSSAVALANLLKISQVSSTDQIRQVMRLMIAPDLMPALHTSSYLAWKAIGGTTDDVVSAYREQALRVCVGVRAGIERAVDENVDIIIDGVHLLADLLDLKPYEGDASFAQVNMKISDPTVFTERFEARGRKSKRRSQHRYIEHLDEIMAIQQHLLEVGEANGVPAVDNDDLDEAVQSLVVTIMDGLRGDKPE